MAAELFAGIPVRDYPSARDWYVRLLGADPSFLAHETEAVWEVTGNGYVYVVQDPDRAGHAVLTLFVEDLDVWVEAASARGIEPAGRETYDNGVRKTTYRDADGNELGIGGAPVDTA